MATISELLGQAFRKYPDRPAIRAENPDDCLTYAQLYGKALRFAGYLESRDVRPGDTIVIALDRSVNYIIAEIGCLLCGFGAALMDAGYPRDRIAYTAENCGAKLILDLNAEEAFAWEKPAEPGTVSEDMPSVIIFTSGSTGRPKGILHTQRSLATAIMGMADLTALTPEDTEGVVAPLTFIAGCAHMLNPLCAGASLVLIDRETYTNPLKLAEEADKLHITSMFISPKVLKVFKPVGDSLRLVLTGSERVSDIGPGRYRLYNMYGMSETSCLTAFEIESPCSNTPIGRALNGRCVYLLDQDGKRCDEGEICVTGDVMEGYIGLPEKTAEVIQPNPFYAEDGHERLYHTGDLGKWDEDGNLVFINRMDWMVKINGQRVEPGEIEAVIRELPQIRDAAVKGLENDRGQSWLCAWYVQESEIQEDEIRHAIAKKLPAYMIPARFVRLDAMPVNANGKLDRKALPEPDLQSETTEYLAPTNETEAALCDAMAQALGLPKVGIRDDFFRLGGDSIGCMRVIAQMDDHRLDMRLIYQNKTPEAISRALSLVEQDDPESRNSVAIRNDQPLTPYQLYYLDYQLYSPKRAIAVIPYLVRFERNAIDVERFRTAVDEALRFHPAYCTVFLYNETGELVQRYCPELFRPAEFVEIAEEEVIASLKKCVKEPFRLFGNVLYRCRICLTEKNVYLFLNMHHSLTDGASMALTLRSVFAFYEGGKPQPDYYYAWLEKSFRNRNSEQYKQDMSFMRSVHDLENCAKYPRLDHDSRENILKEQYLDTGRSCGEYLELCSRTGYTVTEYLVTAALLAISRYNGQDRVSIEWLYAGRAGGITNAIVGNLLSGIPCTVDLSAFPDPRQLLDEVKRQNAEGIRYADCSYAIAGFKPVEEERFKVIFEPRIKRMKQLPVPFERVSIYDALEGNTTVFSVIAYEGTEEDNLSLILGYNAALYDDESIARFGREYLTALEELVN